MSGKFKPPMPVGIIDLGAHSIRLEIFQVEADRSYRLIEHLIQPVSIGREVFSKGMITPQSMNMICAVMRDYVDKLREYGVTYLRAFGTSAVREAVNRDILIDRVGAVSGVKLKVLEASEESRLSYLAIRKHLDGTYNLDGEVLYVSLGTGSTWVAFSRGGRLVESEVFGFGTLRLFEEIGKTELGMQRIAGIMESFARSLQRISSVHNLEKDFQGRPPLFVGIGAGGRLLAKIAGGKTSEQSAVIKLSELNAAAERLAGKTVEELADELNVVDYLVRSLAPGCYLFRQLCLQTGINEVIVPMVSTREAVIEEVIRKAFKEQDPFVPDIISTAIAMGDKYRNDNAHAMAVADYCIRIFDLLQDVHRLSLKNRQLLYLAALLHDIGRFVDTRKHHKHSQYLIQHSQLPGISEHDMLLIALVARYHRKAEPRTSHVEYMNLEEEDRVTVCKLASIIRVADSLDRSHLHKLKNAEFSVEGNVLTVRNDEFLDLAVERIILKSKINLFRNTFGMKVILE